MKDNNEIKLELTDSMLEQFKDVFEIDAELLQGTNERLPNGMNKIVIHVSDAKLQMFKDLTRIMMSLPTDQVKVSIMGVEITKN